MTAPLTRGGPRVARGTVVALLTASLAVGAHVAAGGLAPSAPVLAGVVGTLVAGCIGASARRWTVRPLLAAFLLVQAAVHGLSMLQHPDVVTPHGPGMVVAHVVAAALLVVVVLRGERTLADLVDHLLLRARRLVVVAVPATERPLCLAPRTDPVRRAVPADVLGRAPPVAA